MLFLYPPDVIPTRGIISGMCVIRKPTMVVSVRRVRPVRKASTHVGKSMWDQVFDVCACTCVCVRARVCVRAFVNIYFE